MESDRWRNGEIIMGKIDYEVPTQLWQELRHLTLERNIVVFDSKDEAIKFIKTIPFRNIPQKVILNKRDKKWVVHYLTLEEEE